MPMCLKCTQEFPNWVVIEGQNRNTSNRKFCLECSPFGMLNRSDLRKRPLHKSPIMMSDSELFVVGPTYHHSTLKKRLLLRGVLYECTKCGISEWHGKPLALHLDHINGVPDDHRLDNLRLLCPNCHSQTDTYGGRNAKKRPKQNSNLQHPAS